MAWTKQQLLDYWNANINTNGIEAITGAIMNTGGVEIINAMQLAESTTYMDLVCTTREEIIAAVDRVNGTTPDLLGATIWLLGTIDIASTMNLNLNNINLAGLNATLEMRALSVLNITSGHPIISNIQFTGVLISTSPDNQHIITMGAGASRVTFMNCRFKNVTHLHDAGTPITSHYNVRIDANAFDEIIFIWCTNYTEGIGAGKEMSGFAVHFMQTTGSFSAKVTGQQQSLSYADTLRYVFGGTSNGKLNLLTDSSPIIVSYAGWVPTNYIAPKAVTPYAPSDELMVNTGGLIKKILASDLINQGSLGFAEFSYIFSSATTATPAAGYVNYNTATITGVTTIYINMIDGNNVDRSMYFDNLKEGDWINLHDRLAATTRYNQFDLTGPPVKVGSVYQIPVVYHGSAGAALTNNMKLALYIRFAGAGGGEIDTDMFVTEYNSNSRDAREYAGNLNSIDTAGLYYITSAATNKPDAGPGLLTFNQRLITPLGISGSQEYVGTSGEKFYRTVSANIWSAWKRVPIQDTASPNVLKQFWVGTQAAYDGLTPDANTIYFIT